MERKFAADLDSLQNVKFYMKLPRWFRIPTPLGDYIPDWAVVFDGDKRLYFVAETKSTNQELRPSENMKITCAKKHFASNRSTYDDLVYAAPVSEVREMVADYGARSRRSN